jgi:hypothetical protein
VGPLAPWRDRLKPRTGIAHDLIEQPLKLITRYFMNLQLKELAIVKVFVRTHQIGYPFPPFSHKQRRWTV